MAAKEEDWIVRRRELAEARAKEGEHNLIWREMTCPYGFGKEKEGPRPMTTFSNVEHRAEVRQRNKEYDRMGYSQAARQHEERWGNPDDAVTSAAEWFQLTVFITVMAFLCFGVTFLFPSGSGI